jgi:hypothetical protein
MPEPVLEATDTVLRYASDASDWLIVRKEIIRLMKPVDRSWFARRHYSTKLPLLCETDFLVLDYWEQKTGKRLLIDTTRLHPTSTWSPNPKGWGLTKFNHDRKLSKSSPTEKTD